MAVRGRFACPRRRGPERPSTLGFQEGSFPSRLCSSRPRTPQNAARTTNRARGHPLRSETRRPGSAAAAGREAVILERGTWLVLQIQLLK